MWHRYFSRKYFFIMKVAIYLTFMLYLAKWQYIWLVPSFCLHNFPVNPGRHLHLKESPTSEHFPPFLQGSEEHGETKEITEWNVYFEHVLAKYRHSPF